MPTSLRRSRRFSALSCTAWPQHWMVPLSMVSSRSMQRSAVLLPEPLWPMMATTCPRVTENDTPLSTCSLPKCLWTSLSSTTGCIELPFKGATPSRERITKNEIQHHRAPEIQEGLERRVVQHLGVVGKLGIADHQRCDRRVLDDLHQEAHGGRRRDAQRLRQD